MHSTHTFKKLVVYDIQVTFKLYIVPPRYITILHLISLSPIQVNSSMCIFPKDLHLMQAYEAWDFCTLKEKSCKATGIHL